MLSERSINQKDIWLSIIDLKFGINKEFKIATVLLNKFFKNSNRICI